MTRMKIHALFSFADGRTAFAVEVGKGVPYVEPGTYAIERDGQRVATIELEGEMMTDPPLSCGLRSVSTKDDLSIDREDLGRHDYAIVFQRKCGE